MATSSQRLIAQRYAQSWMGAAEEGKAVDAVADDVTLLQGSIQADAGIVRMLDNPVVPRKALNAAIDGLAKAHKLHKLTVSTLQLLIRNRRIKVLPYALSEMQELIAEKHGEASAKIITASELNDGQQKNYASAMEKAAGKKVHCEFVVRPGILGGAIVKLGPMQVDASLQGKLQRLTMQMQQGMATGTSATGGNS